MPNYVSKTLRRFQYQPQTPQYSPFKYNAFALPRPGQQQYAPQPSSSPLLPEKERTYIQSIVGSFLYYARVVDSTLLPALNELSREQNKPTISTKQKAHHLMDYVDTFPHAFLRFHANDMVLHIDSDAAYLVQPNAKSRIAGFFRLQDAGPSSSPHPNINGAVLVECKTLRHVVASAAEAETAGVFHNAQMGIPIRTLLIALGHPQPPTPLKTDNSTTAGFIHNNIHLKKSKTWDMRLHWLRDREAQRQFQFFWEKGNCNYADYFTKHHPVSHHKTIRSTYVQDKEKNDTEKLNLLSHDHYDNKTIPATYVKNKANSNQKFPSLVSSVRDTKSFCKEKCNLFFELLNTIEQNLYTARVY